MGEPCRGKQSPKEANPASYTGDIKGAFRALGDIEGGWALLPSEERVSAASRGGKGSQKSEPVDKPSSGGEALASPGDHRGGARPGVGLGGAAWLQRVLKLC